MFFVSIYVSLSFVDRRGKWYDEPKYLVTHGKLVELLEVCEHCSSTADASISDTKGAYVRFQALCFSCGHCRFWETSPIQGKLATINILLC